ncbi:RimK family alpha-L-glutamate ligase [Phenylobacterium aquaticum]|uniref:ATP-grasp domain-containing protein n=1 Tax=Phenylobacterium aquaticum TaxID=1763816 RepID=UPI0026EFDA68|nr:hypothetical protein [Phenylobacterium aquaticum]
MTLPALIADADIPQVLGLSHLAQQVFDEVDLTPVFNSMTARVNADSNDAAAWYDIALMLTLTGQIDRGLEIQALAMQASRLYRRVHGDGSDLRILAFVTPGDLMANTPLDFLLEGSNIRLDLLYVEPGVALPAELPDHDLAFLAIGESKSNAVVLAALEPVLAAWPRPVVNGRPLQIAGLTRDGVAAQFADSGRIVAPTTRRLTRADLYPLAVGETAVSDLLPGASFPIIIRPIDSHAGLALEKCDAPDDLAGYLAQHPGPEFFVTDYVDYASPDGKFRKQRVAIIGGVPFISHLAVSDHWMVHYLSAGMAEKAERRAEEAAFMEAFDSDFAVRHAQALAEMTEGFGLDYYAIDCGETADGQLLLFEADVAMIVHAMDSETLFPYKKPAMKKLFAAFQQMLQATADHQALGIRAA